MNDDIEYLEELTRVNNELSSISRQLAKKNIELERTKKIEIERARLLESQTFSGAIAHMVNNIMTKISLTADLIASKQSLDEDGRSRIADIKNEIQQSSDLIDRILLVTHVDEKSRETFDLDTVIKQVIEGFSEKRDCISVSYGVADRFVDANSKLIQMAVHEIIANGLEASVEAHPQRVNVETYLENEGKSFVVAVSDNGTGIPEDIADRIFMPFVTSRFLGRGLGLSLAKQAADSFGGDLKWERSAAMTTFKLTIPALTGKG